MGSGPDAYGIEGAHDAHVHTKPGRERRSNNSEKARVRVEWTVCLVCRVCTADRRTTPCIVIPPKLDSTLGGLALFLGTPQCCCVVGETGACTEGYPGNRRQRC